MKVNSFSLRIRSYPSASRIGSMDDCAAAVACLAVRVISRTMLEMIKGMSEIVSKDFSDICSSRRGPDLYTSGAIAGQNQPQWGIRSLRSAPELACFADSAHSPRVNSASSR